ncbi:MAG: hypothetical protein ABSC54_07975 [Smithellaceae bacterium]|jgi:hypothetical protein
MKRAMAIVTILFILVAILYLVIWVGDIVVVMEPAIRPYAAVVLVLAIVAIWFLRARKK